MILMFSSWWNLDHNKFLCSSTASLAGWSQLDSLIGYWYDSQMRLSLWVEAGLVLVSPLLPWPCTFDRPTWPGFAKRRRTCTLTAPERNMGAMETWHAARWARVRGHTAWDNLWLVDISGMIVYRDFCQQSLDSLKVIFYFPIGESTFWGRCFSSSKSKKDVLQHDWENYWKMLSPITGSPLSGVPI